MPLRPGRGRRLHLLLRLPPERRALQRAAADLRHDVGSHGPQHRGGAGIHAGRQHLRRLRPVDGVLLPRGGVDCQPGLPRGHALHALPRGRAPAAAPGEPPHHPRRAAEGGRLEEADSHAQEQGPRRRRGPHRLRGPHQGLGRGDPPLPRGPPLGYGAAGDRQPLLCHRYRVHRGRGRRRSRLGEPRPLPGGVERRLDDPARRLRVGRLPPRRPLQGPGSAEVRAGVLRRLPRHDSHARGAVPGRRHRAGRGQV
mmetsp:Transcript_60146/g.176482  ORF Transcript_60146/g.176482 Transcript_60146/m.176482 type:complete len:254 (+) Transcript_60146:576-1337(+)